MNNPGDWYNKEQDINDRKGQGNALFTQAAVELMSEMRSLWEQHVAWTRMTIISIASDAPDPGSGDATPPAQRHRHGRCH